MTSSQAPAVSVIVPTHQRRRLVVRAVESVLSQLFQDLELIVVDDGSTDGTGRDLATFGDSVRLLQQPNRGAAAARNTGLAVARGELVAFLDSDNSWLPEHLALLVDALDQNPEAVLSSSLAERSRGKPQARSAAARVREPLPRLLIGNTVGSLSTVVARREAVIAAGGFNESLRVAEDADLWVRLAIGGGPFVFVPRPTVLKGYGAGSLLATRKSGEYAEALETGTTTAIAGLGEGEPDQIAQWLRGRLHLLHALKLLQRSDRRGARAEFAAAGELLPELTGSFDSIVNHLRFNQAANVGVLARVSQALALLGAWPNDLSLLSRRDRARTVSDFLRPAERSRPSGASLRLRQCMMRTDRSPLRPVWRIAHEWLAYGVATYLRRGDRAVSAYIRGSLRTGEAIYGLSDIDLAFVVADTTSPDRGRALRRRWRVLRKRLPSGATGLIEPPQVYREADLHEWSTSTTFTDGSGSGPLRPAERERRRARDGAERSLLPGLSEGWRLIGGRERRKTPGPPNPDDRRLSAWLELQFWWLQAFRACAHPSARWAPYSCVKLMTEPARIWFWLVHGKRFVKRRELIGQAIRELPEEESALRCALAVLDSLEREPAPPLTAAVESCWRVSQRIAKRLATDIGSEGTTDVRLLGGVPDRLIVPVPSLTSLQRALGHEHSPLPLVDWRARVWSLPSDECFTPVDASRMTPGFLGSTAIAGNAGAYAGLRGDDLLVLPSLRRARVRAVQCPLTDPVSFALLDGSATARFPNVRGWSARDSARRAASEHLGWLASSAPHDDEVAKVSRLFTAARAALFLKSLDTDRAELALTVTDVADALEDVSGGTVAVEAGQAYRAARFAGEPFPHGLVEALRRAVSGLSAYALTEH